MSRRLPQVGGCFLQAESEVAAINMVYGAGGAGARVMTSSSSPGISLKQEGHQLPIAGAEVPCVIVNIMRGRTRALAASNPRRAIITNPRAAAAMAITAPVSWRLPACRKL